MIYILTAPRLSLCVDWLYYHEIAHIAGRHYRLNYLVFAPPNDALERAAELFALACMAVSSSCSVRELRVLASEVNKDEIAAWSEKEFQVEVAGILEIWRDRYGGGAQARVRSY